MLIKHLEYLACPECEGELGIEKVDHRRGESIESGMLSCQVCGRTFNIIRNIPRFVPLENYSSSFGLEWTIHARTQYDGYTGLNLSEERFFEETKWPRNLEGQSILEVGSGAGRFTEHAASTGAFVASMDHSVAVESNYRFNGHKENVLIVQGTIYAMPFRKETFDKLFCFGLLQHTPAPGRAFRSLSPYLQDGGRLVVDCYKKSFRNYFSLKKYVRPFTRKMEPEKLYPILKKYVDIMWPFCSLMRKIPKIGLMINWALCIADYSNLGLSGELLKECAYLDTFDMLAARYDNPQSLKTIKRYFRDAGLVEVEVHDGYNGIKGRGKVSRRPDI